MKRLFSMVQLFACTFMLSWFLSPTGAVAQLAIVLEAGDPAPAAAEIYKTVRRPDAGAAGAVAFRAKTKGAAVPSRGIFAATTGPGTEVALRDDVVPSGGFYRRFSRPSTNAVGDVAWEAQTVGGAGRGVFLDSAGLDTVILRNDINPGSAGGFFTKFRRPAVTDGAGVSFYANLSGGSESEGLFRCVGGDGNCSSGSGTLEQLVAPGDPVDGGTREICALSENFDASSYGIAFRAKTGVPGCGGATNDGVLRMAYGGTIEQLAKAGDVADSDLVGVWQHNRFDGPPAINNVGDTSFLAETTPAREIIYYCEETICPAAIPDAVVEQGDDVGGFTLVSRFKAAGINDSSDVSFQAIGDGPLERGLGVYIRRSGGAFETVAFKNDVATAGLTFRKVRLPSMNPSGYVAFRAKVKSTIDNKSRFAIFTYN